MGSHGREEESVKIELLKQNVVEHDVIVATLLTPVCVPPTTSETNAMEQELENEYAKATLLKNDEVGLVKAPATAPPRRPFTVSVQVLQGRVGFDLAHYPEQTPPYLKVTEIFAEQSVARHNASKPNEAITEGDMIVKV